MRDERVERVATGATVEQWWGWNIERQKWFPCLQREERECVVDGGVIVFASIEGRDRRRDEIVGMARAAIAALDEEPPLEDVLGSDQRFAVMYVGIVQQGDDDWVALVDDARTKKRVEGVGSTIDAAIRAAVQHAKEQG